MAFNPREHLLQLKSREGSKDYLPVQWRLVWVNTDVDQAARDGEEVEFDIQTVKVVDDPERECTVETYAWNAEKRRSEKILKTAKGYCEFEATVFVKIGNVKKRGMGNKAECAANFSDYKEKAQTGAIGRALATLGYGTQFTADEFDEGHRIVDSPVDRPPAPASESRNGQSNGSTTSARPDATANASNSQAGASSTTPESEVITQEQLNSIRKLCERLGKSAPENVTTLSYLAARKVIRELTAEFRELQAQKNRAS